MDQVAVRAALCFPAAEAPIADRTAQLRVALARARGHLRAELRLLDALATVGQAPARLRACG